MMILIGCLVVIFGLCVELESLKRDFKGGRK